jgi:TRAP-type C4-dicarboxylate transport system substrate-binding protein
MWSKKTWDKFTPEEQAKLELIGPMFQNYITMGNIAMSKGPRDKNVTTAKGHENIIWPDKDMKKMKELFRPLWDEWAKNMDKKGYPGTKILKEAESLMNAYTNG